MGYLIALGLLVLLAMALLSPYGRRVLAVMVAICAVLILGLILLQPHSQSVDDRERAAEARPESSLPGSGQATLDKWAAGGQPAQQ